MRYLVTGGAGFIGSALVRSLIQKGGHNVLNLDKLTYAANLANLAPIADSPNYSFQEGDICDEVLLADVFARFAPDAVMHLAAESHVDRSIDHPSEFIDTNIMGSYRLLEAALKYYEKLPSGKADSFRFLHVSTDEVFGSLSLEDDAFNFATAYDPKSPYSASKAASDHLARAWQHTYGLPLIITNCSNNYGPYQFPEKFIPLMILNSLQDKKLPVYGAGDNIRDWLYVDDHCQALQDVLAKGRVGETYLIGGNAGRSNLDMVNLVCKILDDLKPKAGGGSYAELIEFVQDRAGHDFRYAIDISETTKAIGWTPSVGLEEGLRLTVQWYLDHPAWWQSIADGTYNGERLGLGRSQEKKDA